SIIKKSLSTNHKTVCTPDESVAASLSTFYPNKAIFERQLMIYIILGTTPIANSFYGFFGNTHFLGNKLTII
ncbi:TPA: hypothetical protein ACKRB1_001806, partial [Streptococcus pyogenes]